MDNKLKSVLYGSFAVIIVILLNWFVLAYLGFPLMAVEIVGRYWILLVLLIGGFGLQVGLFTYYHSLNAVSCSTTVASGGISAVSMILCCSHYLLNFLPFLGAFIGISAFAFLSKYTVYFLWLGVVSNVIGISVLYYQKNKVFRRGKNGK